MKILDDIVFTLENFVYGYHSLELLGLPVQN